MDSMVFGVMAWGGPFGLGFILVSIGAMVLMLAKASEISERTKRKRLNYEKKDDDTDKDKKEDKKPGEGAEEQ